MGDRTAAGKFQGGLLPLALAEGSGRGPPRVVLPPVLREYGMDIRDATLRRHPLLEVEAVLIGGLL
jgi:hypothetical protein